MLWSRMPSSRVTYSTPITHTDTTNPVTWGASVSPPWMQTNYVKHCWRMAAPIKWPQCEKRDSVPATRLKDRY